jgi:DNA polymerase
MEQRTLFGSDQLKVGPNLRELSVLKETCLQCTACKLSEDRTNAVFGEGRAEHPPIAFVGEAPGADEDNSGRPFVGRAGQLLDKMIEAMGFKRQDIYILNTVNCRPPQNRKPEPEEIAACSRYLVGQLRSVQPLVIVAMGATAAQTLLKTKKGVGELRNVWHKWEEIPVRVTFHPAYLLRNPNDKNVAWADLKTVLTRLEQMKLDQLKTANTCS